MKAIKGSLAVICLLGLAVVAVSALVDYKPKPARAVTYKAQDVYVDSDRLMTYHPAWKQVLNLRAAIRELGGTEIPLFTEKHATTDGEEWSVTGTADAKSRDELSKKVEQNALTALSGVESLEREKIKRFIAAKRAELEAETRAAITEKTRETNEKIASAKRNIEHDRSSGRLAAQLKIASLKSRTGSVNAAEDKIAREGLAEAEKYLQQYDSETSEMIERECRVPQDELDRYKAQARLEIESRLTALGSERESDMLSSIKSQRDQTLNDLHGDALEGLVVSKSPNAERGLQVSSRKSSEWNAAAFDKDEEAIQKLRQAEARLISTIRSDVKRLVEKTARGKHWNVTYVRDNKEIPDYTQSVAGVISSMKMTRRMNADTGGSG